MALNSAAWLLLVAYVDYSPFGCLWLARTLRLLEKINAGYRGQEMAATTPFYGEVTTPRVEGVRSTKETVYSTIRELVINGYFPVRQRFSEQKVIRVLETECEIHTSRAAVGQAVYQLAKEGLLIQIPQVGLYVRELSDAEKWELIELRLLNEPLVASRLALQHKEADFGRLEALMDEMKNELTDKHDQRFFAADTKFHCAIAELAGRPTVARTLQSLRDRMQVYVIGKGGKREVFKEHTKIFRAIRNGNAQRAREAMIEHIWNVAERYELFETGREHGDIRRFVEWCKHAPFPGIEDGRSA